LPDGTINLGKYGQLVVAGQSVAEIEKLVQAAVATQTKEPGFVSVRLVSRQSKVYYVIGEVNSPGAFPLSGRETALDAIMQAGGLTDNAARGKIRVKRRNPDGTFHEMFFNYSRIVAGKDVDPDLETGDVVVVKESLF